MTFEEGRLELESGDAVGRKQEIGPSWTFTLDYEWLLGGRVLFYHDNRPDFNYPDLSAYHSPKK